jgi:hypothetical protein
MARLWWFLLPSTGFFAYPDDTTTLERLRWCVPYALWRVVNALHVDPFKPVTFRPCNCDLCAASLPVEQSRPE